MIRKMPSWINLGKAGKPTDMRHLMRDYVLIMATFGYWAWIELPLNYDGEAVENAGMYLQIAATVLAAGICFFLPANARIMQLEN